MAPIRWVAAAVDRGTLAEGHTAADNVEAAIGRVLPGADVVVHVEPSRDGQTLPERVLAAALSVPGVREAHHVTVFDLDGGKQVSLHLKLPPEMPLTAGETVAHEVEDAIMQAVPQVSSVQTHLEPLDPEIEARPLAPDTQERLASTVLPIVRRLAGATPRELRFVDTDAGVVGFVTLALDANRSIATAHRLASAIEQTVHDQIPEIHELVIHTEP